MVKSNRLKTVRIQSVTNQTVCYARPPLVQDDRQLNPMLHCTLKKRHRGPHSWEQKQKQA